jgi:16S rRNA U516 pseudouridylate synthase RsuA-like enzyme
MSTLQISILHARLRELKELSDHLNMSTEELVRIGTGEIATRP